MHTRELTLHTTKHVPCRMSRRERAIHLSVVPYNHTHTHAHTHIHTYIHAQHTQKEREIGASAQ